MLAPRRRCVGYSKVCCDVRRGWLPAWNQNRHITYFIFYIPYTNSEVSVGLLYICPTSFDNNVYFEVLEKNGNLSIS